MADLKKRQKGFTLAEVLIVFSIVAMLGAIVFGVLRQLNKGRDSQRKDDLEIIRVAFEDYFNDHGCYPAISVLESCGGNDLAPYLESIPCDPQTNDPYVGLAGVLVGDSSCNNWYRVYSLLEDTKDSAIAKLGLSTTPVVEGHPVNYGVSSPNVLVAEAVYTCPLTGQPALRATSCFNPEDYVGQCGIGSCGCDDGKIFGSTEDGYYCCRDDGC